MKQYHILYNPQAGGGNAAQRAHQLDHLLGGARLFYRDMTEIVNYAAFFNSLDPLDDVVIAGGDGTLNRFINDTQHLHIPNRLLYFAVGSGNDFLHDLGLEAGSAPIEIGSYIRSLPTVSVNGKTYRFLNGVGYGIDGYCCQVGDRMRHLGKQHINYASIAIKGLLFHYHPTHAVVTVDGVRHEFDRVWLAPTMNGRFYGGGMMVTPAQNRSNPDGTLSVCVMFSSSKLKTLYVFPSIFKGKHVSHRRMVRIFTGRDICVEFDRPTALQIDGETILGVTQYHARSAGAQSAQTAAGT